jgi:RNA polymerase sigma factor, sigma-70 family
MKRIDSDSLFIKTAMQAPYLEKDEEIKLISAWRNEQDKRALDKLTLSHMRLVIAIAYRFKNYGLPLAELIQEGSVGMMEAAKRFDMKHQVRFSTYATWWIKASIRDYILKNWSIVRSGTSSVQKSLFFSLRQLRARLQKSGDDALSDDVRKEIAEAVGVSVEDVRLMETRLSAPDLSLNAPVNDHESDLQTERIELLVDNSALPDEIVAESIDGERQKSWLNDALVVLNERELNIIKARRLKDKQETLDELGSQLGISKERVRQIENNALLKLRRKLSTEHPAILAA